MRALDPRIQSARAGCSGWPGLRPAMREKNTLPLVSILKQPSSFSRCMRIRGIVSLALGALGIRGRAGRRGLPVPTVHVRKWKAHGGLAASTGQRSRRPARGVGGLLRMNPGGDTRPRFWRGPSIHRWQDSLQPSAPWAARKGQTLRSTYDEREQLAGHTRLGPPHLRCERICGHRIPAPLERRLARAPSVERGQRCIYSYITRCQALCGIFSS